MKTVGSRAEVFHGTAKRTTGQLERKHLTVNSKGRIVSIAKSNQAKRNNNLGKYMIQKTQT